MDILFASIVAGVWFFAVVWMLFHGHIVAGLILAALIVVPTVSMMRTRSSGQKWHDRSWNAGD